MMPHMPGFGSLICLTAIAGIIAGVVLLIIYLSKPSGTQSPYNSQFPAPPSNLPGFYLVKGVDRNTRLDASLRIQAESEANARVKAELAGVIVTSIHFEGPGV